MKIIYIIIYLLILSCAYYFLDQYSSENIFFIRDSNEHKISFWEAIYFTIITQSTIGYGDIVPKTNHIGEGMIKIFKKHKFFALNARKRAVQKFDIAHWIERHQIIFDQYLIK